jgi:serine/threonine protein kinase
MESPLRRETPMRSYTKICTGEIKGRLRKEIAESLPPAFFEDPIAAVQSRGGRVLRNSRLRWAAILTLPAGRRIFLKRDKTKGWGEALKYLFLPSKARKEWFIASRLKKSYPDVPEPLGWMERVRRGFVVESYYVSEAIGSGASIMEDPEKREKKTFWIDQLAKAVRNVHRAGLFHRDFHAGNFLWNGERLLITDLHSARLVRTLSTARRLRNLAELFHSLRTVWGDPDRLAFLERYLEGSSFPARKKERILDRVHSLMDRLQKRRWRSRTRRCMKESTEFSIRKEKGVRYYLRREYPLDQIKRVVEAHLSLVKEKPSSLVKYSSEVTVSILYTAALTPAKDVIPAKAGIQENTGFPRIKYPVSSTGQASRLVQPGMTNCTGLMASCIDDGEKRVCVKQFRYLRFLDGFKEHFRRSKGLRSWFASNGLRVRGIDALQPLGLMEVRNWLGLRESFFLMEAAEPNQEIDRFLSSGFVDFREKRAFIRAFARFLSHLHQRRLYHRDMKTCNLLVSKKGESWNFLLLDLEDLSLEKKVGEAELFRSFLQLNTSTPKIITRADRMRFFKEYLRRNSIVKDRKRFLKKLVRESRKRGLVYVSPQGVIEESFS